MANMRKLQQGQIVSYFSTLTKQRVPGIITNIIPSQPDMVDLVIFFPNAHMFVWGITQGNELGQWQWPDMID